jgi:hypothetical protein
VAVDRQGLCSNSVYYPINSSGCFERSQVSFRRLKDRVLCFENHSNVLGPRPKRPVTWRVKLGVTVTVTHGMMERCFGSERFGIR